MRLKPVASEMLEAVGYDSRRRLLEVIFNSGDKYRYKEVPPFEYEGLMCAEPIGQYMHKRIIGALSLRANELGHKAQKFPFVPFRG